jgi:hypothetical protein
LTLAYKDQQYWSAKRGIIVSHLPVVQNVLDLTCLGRMLGSVVDQWSNAHTSGRTN